MLTLEALRSELVAMAPARRLAAGDRVWIFGTGLFGRALAGACAAQQIEVAGFVQTTPTAATCEGRPVLALQSLSASEKAQPLLLGIFNRDMPFDGLEQLARSAGWQDVRMPWELHAQFAEQLGWRYWLGDPAFLAQHADEIAHVHGRLHDEASRDCLLSLVRFRLGLQSSYGSFTHPDAQYFNALTLPALAGRPLRYLDGGAYSGDSLLELLELADVKEAWLFEPDAANFAKLCQTVRARRLPGLCLPLALADGYRLLRFRSGLGEAGNVDPAGDEGIATVSIDAVLAGQPVDLIKLDVEGSETQALEGAVQTLNEHRPVLALSAYHRPEDLWALPALIDRLCPGYRFSLRQHTHNSFDLVLYGVHHG